MNSLQFYAISSAVGITLDPLGDDKTDNVIIKKQQDTDLDQFQLKSVKFWVVVFRTKYFIVLSLKDEILAG